MPFEFSGRKEIHKFIIELAQEGIAILLISSYLPELLNLCDNILVARAGQVVQELSIDEASEEAIMLLATATNHEAVAAVE